MASIWIPVQPTSDAMNYVNEQFAQGLLDVMQNYQRMEPRKLTDETLESILWNKVPVELQEVKEITDGSVQEILHRLLRAEAVLQERERRTSQQTPRSASLE